MERDDAGVIYWSFLYHLARLLFAIFFLFAVCYYIAWELRQRFAKLKEVVEYIIWWLKNARTR